ncbi:MAG: hypothetical protein WC208_09745 [Gallionella sp.]|jgi:hypothetical protein
MKTEFARIILSSDGRQVLFYVEPDCGDFTFHQVTNHNGFQADINIAFTSPDEAENERRAYAALDVVDQAVADRVVDTVSDAMSKLMGEVAA